MVKGLLEPFIFDILLTMVKKLPCLVWGGPNLNGGFNESVQVSTGSIGIVRAYSVVTTDGIFRKSNEDRVSILQNIISKSQIDEKCSFFGVYDGHGGDLCAEF